MKGPRYNIYVGWGLTKIASGFICKRAGGFGGVCLKGRGLNKRRKRERE
jgi:hypothetical protein